MSKNKKDWGKEMQEKQVKEFLEEEDRRKKERAESLVLEFLHKYEGEKKAKKAYEEARVRTKKAEVEMCNYLYFKNFLEGVESNTIRLPVGNVLLSFDWIEEPCPNEAHATVLVEDIQTQNSLYNLSQEKVMEYPEVSFFLKEEMRKRGLFESWKGCPGFELGFLNFEKLAFPLKVPTEKGEKEIDIPLKEINTLRKIRAFVARLVLQYGRNLELKDEE